MKNRFSSAVCAAALLLSSVSVDAILAPASAQTDYSVDFDTFHDQLAPYGDWVYSDRWGEIWLPSDVPADFHPYGTGGHWGYTDEYGWTWVSDYDWGDIPFHYGRWVNDPDDGWLWIPGYIWSPGWVIWRSNGQYTGWMPMPPDDAFLNGGGPSVGFSIDFNNTGGYYGYSQWYGSDYGEDRFAANWVFVGAGHICDHDYRRYEAPAGNYATIIRNTTNITNYTVVNNYIVNKSVDVQVFERASGHPVQTLAIANIIHKPQFITHADAGQAIQTRMRAEIPRGNGHAGSAPKPSPQMVQSLSQKVAPHNGKQPTHLFTRDTVAKAPLAKAPTMGAEPAGPGVMEHHGNAVPPTSGGVAPSGSSERPAEDKTRAHLPSSEPSMSGPSSSTAAHGTINTEQPSAPPRSTGRERPAPHEMTTAAPNPSIIPENNGGMGHANTNATTTPRNLESAPAHRERVPTSTIPQKAPPSGPSAPVGGGTHPVGSGAHVPANTAAPSKPAPRTPPSDQSGEEKPKHDGPAKPQ